MAKEKAKALRKNMTDAEHCLWKHLRNRNLLGYKFRRQHPVKQFIVDFVCLDKGLVIEVDGGQHAEHECYDNYRTSEIQKQGFRVIRFWNNEVLGQTESVLEKIIEVLENPHPNPSP